MAAVEIKPFRIQKPTSVYRKLFEAEVSLVKSLAKERRPPPMRISKKALPLIRPLAEETTAKHGMLTSKQREWTRALPNDGRTGNPATKKEKTLDYEERVDVEEEVRGLPDIVRPSSKGTDIVSRIERSRKERHDSSVNDLHSELSSLSLEFESRISEIATRLKDQLSAYDADVDEIFSRIESDEALVAYSLNELSRLWDEVSTQYGRRQAAILDFDDALELLEQDRTEMISDVFKYYSAHFESIAHLDPSDVIRFVASEAQLINSSILSNRRTYANMIGALLAANVERERRHHDWWLNRLTDWKVLNCEAAQRAFGDFMNSSAILSPPEINKLISFMTAEQQAVNQRRLDLLNQFGTLQPPRCTKTAIYEWNSTMKTLLEELDVMHKRYLGLLEDHQAAINNQCVEEMERCKTALIETGVCNEHTVYEVINQGFLPMVEERQRQSEIMMADIKKSLNASIAVQTGQVQSLFQFGQGAAHLWDEHQTTIREQAKAVQAEMTRCREVHDSKCQHTEVQLDVVMDKMRQDGTEEALDESLRQALSMLDTIKDSYGHFHNEMVAKAQGYPSMIQAALVGYDDGVLKYFSVDRKPAKVKRKGKTRLKDGRQTSLTTHLSHSGRETALPPQEIVSLPNGTTFYVLTEPAEHGVASSNSFFMTENEEDAAGSATRYVWTDGIFISESLFSDVRKGMRNRFLEHLEEWKETAMEEARSFVSVKKEELKGEMDLRLHLHQPRPGRAEMDVRNVRAGELVSHRSRLRQHVQGIVATLNEKKSACSSLASTEESRIQEFRENLERMLENIQAAEKTTELVAFFKQANDTLKSRASSVLSTSNEFRGQLKVVLNGLRISNDSFRKSLKLFSSGGNFCPDEAEEFEQKLDKLSRRVDSVERSLLVDLESVERKACDKYADSFRKWEEKYRHHLFDLGFVEKVQRSLTTTQVKIKTAVAASNSQAKGLGEEIAVIERRCDAVEHPNPDKEQISAKELLDSVPTIFALCRDRMKYLECKHVAAKRSVTVNILVTFDDTPSTGGAAEPTTPRRASRAASRASTSTLPQDPLSAIDLTRNILKQSSQMKESQLQSGNETKSLTVMPRPPPPNDLSAKMVSRSLPGETEKSKSNRINSSRGRTSKGGSLSVKKAEKKIENFGGTDGDDLENFLPQIRSILIDVRVRLFSKCEIYYKQKGYRALTRPQLIHDTVEQCTEALSARLQSYRHQAEDYRKSCIEEFRDQLDVLSGLLLRIVPALFREFLLSKLSSMQESWTGLVEKATEELRELEEERQEHERELRPTLGHPNNAGQLVSLQAKETERLEKARRLIEFRHTEIKNRLEELGRDFLADLSDIAKSSLFLFDVSVASRDVQVVTTSVKKRSTKELIRETQATQEDQDGDDSAGIQYLSKPGSWPELFVEGFPGDRKTSKTTPKFIKTRKSTPFHESVIKERDSVYDDYLSELKALFAEAENWKVRSLELKQSWSDTWSKAVAGITGLY